MGLPRASVHRAVLVGSIPALLVLALVVGAPQLGVLAGAWALLLALSSWRAQRRLGPLMVRRRVPGSAHEDDEMVITVEVERAGPGRVEGVEVTDYFGATLASAQTVRCPEPLRGGLVRELPYGVQCTRTWGVYQVGPLVLSVPDPLGLFVATRTEPELREVALFPRVHAVAGLTARGARPTLRPASVSAGRAGQGELPLGVRDYRAGDDPRRVHWPATARLGHLVVQEQEIDLLPYLTVFVDLAAESRAGLGRRSTLEFLVRTASSILATAVRDGWYVQLLGEGAEPLSVAPGRGSGHLALALDALIRVQMGGGVPLSELVERRLAAVPAGSSAVLLFGTATPDPDSLRAAVEALVSRGADVSAVLVDHASFRAFRRAEESPAVLTARRAQVLSVLTDLAVRHAVLTAEDSVEERLERGLFAS